MFCEKIYNFSVAKTGKKVNLGCRVQAYATQRNVNNIRMAANGRQRAFQ